jgi:NADPH:quinone reductase-like Zn-dependent oxidoreductase
MKAAVLDAAGPPDAFRLADVPVPSAARGQVILALDYASVGSWDGKLRSGDWGPVSPGTILGADGSGTIAAVGPGVDDLHVGERVYAYSYGNPGGGFYAEYVAVPAERVARAPAQLLQDVAGAIPCVGVTALSGLHVLKVKHDRMLLVLGASGGVGSLAVWLASGMKATVIGTARPDAHDYVKQLGAADVVDPRSPEHQALVGRIAPDGFDAALVTGGSETLQQFVKHLRSDAPVAYPNGVEPEPVALRHPIIVFDGEMGRAAMTQLNQAIGTRTIPLELTEFPLDRVVDAHRRLDEGHVVGKIVLRIR